MEEDTDEKSVFVRFRRWYVAVGHPEHAGSSWRIPGLQLFATCRAQLRTAGSAWPSVCDSVHVGQRLGGMRNQVVVGGFEESRRQDASFFCQVWQGLQAIQFTASRLSCGERELGRVPVRPQLLMFVLK